MLRGALPASTPLPCSLSFSTLSAPCEASFSSSSLRKTVPYFLFPETKRLFRLFAFMPFPANPRSFCSSFPLFLSRKSQIPLLLASLFCIYTIDNTYGLFDTAKSNLGHACAVVRELRGARSANAALILSVSKCGGWLQC
mgnify:CR=1 FL=1